MTTKYSKIETYIPSRTSDGSPIPFRDAYVSRVASLNASWFGGTTATESVGYYVNEEGSTVIEQVTVLTTYVDYNTYTECMENYTKYLRNICNEMEQETLLFVVDGNPQFLTPC